LEKERVSFELLQPDSKEKIKEDKKKKDKKPGMLSGLFKRKEKKKGSSDSADPTSPRLGKSSSETMRDSPSIDMDESPTEKQLQIDPLMAPQRSSSRAKLVKSPPSPLSPRQVLSPTGVRPVEQNNLAAPNRPSPDISGSSSESTPRALSPEKAPVGEKPALRVQPPEQSSSSNLLTDLSNKLRSPSREGPGSVKREKVKRAKQREALDIDSSPEEETGANPFADSFEVDNKALQPTADTTGAMNSTERLSESPVHITEADAVPDSEIPALVGDSSSASSADELASLRSSPSPPVTSATITDFNSDPDHFGEPGPTLSESESEVMAHGGSAHMPAPLSFSRPHPPPTALAPPPPTRSPPPQPGANANVPLPPISAHTEQHNPQHSPNLEAVARNNSTSTTASLGVSPTTPLSPPWSDAHLRAYLDDGSEIRDLLLVVHDTSGVVPVGPDHPLMSDLYREEKGKLGEMNLALDGLLGEWLGRRKKGLSAKAPPPPARIA
jgi:hypothetical protein